MRHPKRGRAGGTVVTYDFLDEITRKGHYYRGMSEAEMMQALERGYIKSDLRWSVSDEGTCFGEDCATAYSYANFGRTDPRKTGKPNFVVEVPASAGVGFFIDRRDGYPKTHERVPMGVVTRVWRFSARGDDLVAEDFEVRRTK